MKGSELKDVLSKYNIKVRPLSEKLNITSDKLYWWIKADKQIPKGYVDQIIEYIETETKGKSKILSLSKEWIPAKLASMLDVMNQGSVEQNLVKLLSHPVVHKILEEERVKYLKSLLVKR